MIRTVRIALALAGCMSLSAWAQDSTASTDNTHPVSVEPIAERPLGAFGTLATGAVETYGLQNSAAKVYRLSEGISVGGYAELEYINRFAKDDSGAKAGDKDSIDLHRMVMFLGYRFNDKFVFNSEIEFEHVSELSVEFAYLDWKVHENLALRAGNILVPMGILNEVHEPTTYFGVLRNTVERNIIPSTWHENGLGLMGNVGDLDFRAYGLTGFKALDYSKKGIRSGRQEGGEDVAEDFGGVLRLDYSPLLGLSLGASGYLGGSGQAEPNPIATGDIGGCTGMAEAHATYHYRGLKLAALFAYLHIQDTIALNTVLGLAGADGIGREQIGYYAEAGYNVLSSVNLSHALTPFVRYEATNRHLSVAPGFQKDPALDESHIVAGLQYSPIPMVVVKLDYDNMRTGSDTGLDAVRAGLGLSF